MDIFEIERLIDDSLVSDNAYQEFLRVSALSMGLYSLKSRQIDAQGPHNEAEVYFVVSGKAHIMVAEEIQTVRAGSIIHVPAKVAHKFIDISEDLQVLVFFAPPES